MSYGGLGLAALGLIFLAWAVFSTYAGETYGRSGGVIRRANDPSTFWFLVVFYYLLGFLAVGYGIYGFIVDYRAYVNALRF
jgi:hypothetical protein